MTGGRKGERVVIDDDVDDEDFDPKSKNFCRACVDSSTFAPLKNKNFSVKTKSTTKPCPPDKVELGNASWNVLHSFAAYYPSRPSGQQQIKMNSFLNHFADFYPCRHCAADFKLEMKKDPPNLQSRETLSTWLCNQHNLVNKKLGKPSFDCSKVLERWRTGWSDGSCDYNE